MSLLSKAQEKFENNYKVAVNFEIVARLANPFRFMDNFLVRSRNETPEQARFSTGLTHYLREYIENSILMSEGENCDFSQFDFFKFLEDYEELVDAKHKDSGSSVPRSKYDGFTKEQVFHDIEDCIRAYNKPLSQLWADKIKSGDMTFENLQALVAGEMQNVQLRTNLKEALHNISIAKDTMQNLCATRGRLWKIFNFRQWFKQKDYAAQLVEQVERYNNTEEYRQYLNKNDKILKRAVRKYIADRNERINHPERFTAQRTEQILGDTRHKNPNNIILDSDNQSVYSENNAPLADNDFINGNAELYSFERESISGLGDELNSSADNVQSDLIINEPKPQNLSKTK